MSSTSTKLAWLAVIIASKQRHAGEASSESVAEVGRLNRSTSGVGQLRLGRGKVIVVRLLTPENAT